MKKLFEPLKVEIYYYDETDIVTESPGTIPGYEPGEYETPLLPTSLVGRF